MSLHLGSAVEAAWHTSIAFASSCREFLRSTWMAFVGIRWSDDMNGIILRNQHFECIRNGNEFKAFWVKNLRVRDPHSEATSITQNSKPHCWRKKWHKSHVTTRKITHQAAGRRGSGTSRCWWRDSCHLRIGGGDMRTTPAFCKMELQYAIIIIGFHWVSKIQRFAFQLQDYMLYLQEWLMWSFGPWWFFLSKDLTATVHLRLASWSGWSPLCHPGAWRDVSRTCRQMVRVLVRESDGSRVQSTMIYDDEPIILEKKKHWKKHASNQWFVQRKNKPQTQVMWSFAKLEMKKRLYGAALATQGQPEKLCMEATYWIEWIDTIWQIVIYYTWILKITVFTLLRKSFINR